MLGQVDARPFFFDDALNARAAPSTRAVALLRIFYAGYAAAFDVLLGEIINSLTPKLFGGRARPLRPLAKSAQQNLAKSPS